MAPHTVPFYRQPPSAHETQAKLTRHRQNLRNMKPTVDNHEPSVTSLRHLRHNLKRKQLEEDRGHQITQENTILVGKMISISQGEYKHRCRLYDEPTRPTNRAREPRTMHDAARLREEQRIMRANMQLLERITSAQSSYHTEFKDKTGLGGKHSRRCRRRTKKRGALRNSKTREGEAEDAGFSQQTEAGVVPTHAETMPTQLQPQRPDQPARSRPSSLRASRRPRSVEPKQTGRGAVESQVGELHPSGGATRGAKREAHSDAALVHSFEGDEVDGRKELAKSCTVDGNPAFFDKLEQIATLGLRRMYVKVAVAQASGSNGAGGSDQIGLPSGSGRADAHSPAQALTEVRVEALDMESEERHLLSSTAECVADVLGVPVSELLAMPEALNGPPVSTDGSRDRSKTEGWERVLSVLEFVHDPILGKDVLRFCAQQNSRDQHDDQGQQQDQTLGQNCGEGHQTRALSSANAEHYDEPAAPAETPLANSVKEEAQDMSKCPSTCEPVTDTTAAPVTPIRIASDVFFAVGQRVEVQYHGRQKWYQAKVSRINIKGNHTSYNVEYVDGDKEWGVDPSCIRPISNETETVPHAYGGGGFLPLWGSADASSEVHRGSPASEDDNPRPSSSDSANGHVESAAIQQHVAVTRKCSGEDEVGVEARSSRAPLDPGPSRQEPSPSIISSTQNSSVLLECAEATVAEVLSTALGHLTAS